MSETPQYVSLRVAMEQMEATDMKEFVRVAKLHKCYFEKAGIIRIDVVGLQHLIDQDFAEAQEQAAKRKAAPRNTGSDYGLVEARIRLYPKRIADKKAKIAEAETKVKTAETPHHGHKAQKELTKLQGKLKALIKGQKRDEQRRDDYLNGDVQ